MSEYYDYIVGISAIVGGFLISLLAFILHKKYSKTQCLGTVMLFLSMAYISYAVAESMWFQFSLSDIDPYPSMADLAYGFYYLFIGLALATLFRTFIKRVNKYGVIFVISVIILVYFGYYSLSVYYESEFINYGGLFIVASSLIAAISVVIAFRLHVKTIKYIWIIVAIVITINSVGDVWYYTLENIGIYEYGNFIDGLWFIADLLMIGILLIHYRLR